MGGGRVPSGGYGDADRMPQFGPMGPMMPGARPAYVGESSALVSTGNASGAGSMNGSLVYYWPMTAPVLLALS